MVAQNKSQRTDSLVPGEFSLTMADFRQVAKVLSDEAGIFLSEEKISLVYSRLSKRLRKLGFSNFSDYCEFVKTDAGVEERRNMINALTTNVTRFFREPHHFELLTESALPSLLAEAKKGRRVRIWSAACSSGEEPYSIAMTVLSMLPNAASYDIKILATDIDQDILNRASHGMYRERDLSAVPKADKLKYFNKVGRSGDEWQVNASLKELITFGQLNLIKPWPMNGDFDVIFCRNVVIYFEEATQQKLWSRFHDVLSPEGWLKIGHSERITGPSEAAFKCVGSTSYKLTSATHV